MRSCLRELRSNRALESIVPGMETWRKLRHQAQYIALFNRALVFDTLSVIVDDFLRTVMLCFFPLCLSEKNCIPFFIQRMNYFFSKLSSHFFTSGIALYEVNMVINLGSTIKASWVFFSCPGIGQRRSHKRVMIECIWSKHQDD